RPCAVELHAHCYKKSSHPLDATALRRGASRSLLQEVFSSSGCHGLAPWRLTLTATRSLLILRMPRPCAVEAHAHCYKKSSYPQDATALRRGASRSLLKTKSTQLADCF